jgi:FkbM family methyltransferase
MIKGLERIRQSINSIRLNLRSTKRKKALAEEIDLEKVNHLFKTVQCDHKWYGSSYGGFYINPKLLNARSVVYSFGIGKDISFDKKCIKEHNCRVHGFDPTPKSINYVSIFNELNNFSFHAYGISGTETGVVNFYLPKNPKGVSGSLEKTNVVSEENKIEVEMKTYGDILKELGHSHVDVLKMDIEGSEYSVLESILDGGYSIDQFLIEFHDRLFDNENYRSKQVVDKMHENGYEVFAHSSTFEEISFIHKSKL